MSYYCRPIGPLAILGGLFAICIVVMIWYIVISIVVIAGLAWLLFKGLQWIWYRIEDRWIYRDL